MMALASPTRVGQAGFVALALGFGLAAGHPDGAPRSTAPGWVIDGSQTLFAAGLVLLACGLSWDLVRRVRR